MNRVVRFLALSAFALLALSTAQAQYPVDALRYSYTNLGAGARALSMGGAYVGVADDFYATYWNPAGLGLVKRFEITGGLDNVSFGNDATYYGATQNYTNSVMNFGSIGVVIPFPTQQGSFVLATGYSRPQDFTSAASVHGFNPVTSIAQYMYYDPQSVSGDMAYRLFLEDSLGHVGIRGNVDQMATILEEGRLGSWSFAGAVEAAPGLFLGASLDIYTGTYSYNGTFNESDTKGVYQNYQEGDNVSGFETGFQGLSLTRSIQQDVSGIGAKFGMIYRINKIGNIGITIKTPTALSVKESWSDQGTAYFNTGTTSDAVSSSDLNQNPSYDIVTPFEITGGLSFNVGNLLLAGSFEAKDYSQMKFENSADATTQNQNNLDIKSLYRSTLNLRAGAEFSVPQTDLKLRAGYANLPSPYKGDPSSYAQQYLTFGAGYTIERTLGLDVAYLRGWRDSFDYLYGGNTSGTSFNENMTSNNLIFTITYHF